MLESLDWDSEHFGFPIGRVQRSIVSAAGAASLAAAADRFQCVYWLADPSDLETAEIAAQIGFVVVDVRLILSRSLGTDIAMAKSPFVRRGTSTDIDPLRRIAGSAHTDTRFYFDTKFPRSRVDKMYSIWLENAFREAPDGVFVATQDGAPCGYITCQVRDATTGVIGLVGVGEAARGQGLGQALTGAALEWFRERGLERVEVVTQMRNLTAQRLYARRGFLPHTVNIWYHRWRK